MVILAAVATAMASGATQEAACEQAGLSTRSLQRWMSSPGGDDRRRGPNTTPRNALTQAQRKAVLEAINSIEFRGLPPSQIVPRLADGGKYIASESTMYRLMREAGQLTHRERARPAVARVVPRLEATGPDQVYSWDITYLKTEVRGKFFYLYLMVDIWSRKIVGAEVHDCESEDLAADLFRRVCVGNKLDPRGLVLHSDNGGPMKGSTMAATLEALGVVRSLSRPSVSNDNPYSEALFKTMKYRPEYPDRPFSTVDQAQAWVVAFVRWYNTEHRHSGIRFVTPIERHTGGERSILCHRKEVYEAARAKHPERWSRGTRCWDQVKVVTINPLRDEGSLAV